MSPSLRIKILKTDEVFLLTFNLLRTYYPSPHAPLTERILKIGEVFIFPRPLHTG